MKQTKNEKIINKEIPLLLRETGFHYNEFYRFFDKNMLPRHGKACLN